MLVNIVDSFVRKKTYLLTYLLTYLDNIPMQCVPAWLIQHCIVYFPHKSCLLAMGQHSKGYFLECAVLAQTDPGNIVDFFWCKVVCGVVYGPTLYR